MTVYFLGTWATGVFRNEHPDFGNLNDTRRIGVDPKDFAKIYPSYIDAYDATPFLERAQKCVRFDFAWYSVVDSFLKTALYLDFIARFLFSAELPHSFFDVYNVFDFLSLSEVAPFLLTNPKIAVDSFGFLKWFRLLRATDLAKQWTSDKVLHRAMIAFISLIGIFLAHAGLLLTLEYPTAKELDGGRTSGTDFVCLADAFYFSVTTITTVGFGDFLPATIEGRLTTMAAIILGIVVFTSQFNALFAALESDDQRGGKTLVKRNSTHVVLTGAMEPKAVDMILQELFHPNHMVGDNNTGPQVVLMELSDFLPSQALFEDVIKRHPRQSVTYYRGQGHGPVNVEVSQGSRKQGAAEARRRRGG